MLSMNDWNRALLIRFPKEEDFEATAFGHSRKQWDDARFIVLAYKLHRLINFAEAKHSCLKKRKLLCTWNTWDVLYIGWVDRRSNSNARLIWASFRYDDSWEANLCAVLLSRLWNRVSSQAIFGAGHATNNTVDLVVLVVSSAELVQSLEVERVLVKLKHMPRALWYGTSRNCFLKLHRSFRRERLWLLKKLLQLWHYRNWFMRR